MSAPASIEAYKRKQNVLAAKAHKRRAGALSGKPTSSRSKESYTAEQRRYLNACVVKHADPDERLLVALHDARFMLKLDRFGEEELAFHMEFLRKTKTCTHISISLGSVKLNRDLRTKFDRLGLKRAFAFENEGAAVVVRAASSAAYKTPSLAHFHLIGVKVSPEVVPNLSKALFHCHQLEDVSLSGTNIGDQGLEAIAMALGKCPKLKLISLAGCSLTDKAKEHIAKIITLHGVIKDEAVWSSSLRGEVAASPAMPDLLINLSRNDLGDEAAEAICDALYNDKWLLGLNLGGNNLSQQGTEVFIDTLAKNNHTLAVLALANMKDPVGKSTLDTLDSLLRSRNRFLQQIATESREKRMALGGLLLEWGVDKNSIVEICYLEPPGKDGKTKSVSMPATTPKQMTSVSLSSRSGIVHPRTGTGNNAINATRAFHQDIGHAGSNNDNLEDDEVSDEDEEVVAATADSHVKTIEYLIERLSGLEAERRKTHEFISKLEAENRRLREELQVRPKEASAQGISPIEAQIIAQLETSISSLAEQVEFMEHDKQQVVG